MLEKILQLGFSYSVFILLEFPKLPVYPRVKSNKENEFTVISTAGVLCALSHQVFLVRKVKGSDAGQLYAMKVLKKATLKGERSQRGRHVTVVIGGNGHSVQCCVISVCRHVTLWLIIHNTSIPLST